MLLFEQWKLACYIIVFMPFTCTRQHPEHLTKFLANRCFNLKKSYQHTSSLFLKILLYIFIVHANSFYLQWDANAKISFAQMTYLVIICRPKNISTSNLKIVLKFIGCKIFFWTTIYHLFVWAKIYTLDKSVKCLYLLISFLGTSSPTQHISMIFN